MVGCVCLVQGHAFYFLWRHSRTIYTIMIFQNQIFANLQAFLCRVSFLDIDIVSCVRDFVSYALHDSKTHSVFLFLIIPEFNIGLIKKFLSFIFCMSGWFAYFLTL